MYEQFLTLVVAIVQHLSIVVTMLYSGTSDKRPSKKRTTSLSRTIHNGMIPIRVHNSQSGGPNLSVIWRFHCMGVGATDLLRPM